MLLSYRNVDGELTLERENSDPADDDPRDDQSNAHDRIENRMRTEVPKPMKAEEYPDRKRNRYHDPNDLLRRLVTADVSGLRTPEEGK